MEFSHIITPDNTPTPETANIIGNEAPIFKSRTANEWIRRAHKRKNPVSLWYDLWYEGEVCCLFADSNVGKSVYAVQIANHISSVQKVLYFDFEMSDKQFQMRYTDDATDSLYPFNDNFIRLELNTGSAIDDLALIIKHIEHQIISLNAKVIIIDNLSWLCNRSEDGDCAGKLMQLLIDLKRRHDLSILVLAHTPKRNLATPLTQNSLAGSKKIANFMDSIFAIGLIASDTAHGRYIKQIKVRSSELQYGCNNVIIGELVKHGNFVKIEHQRFGIEADQLNSSTTSPSAEERECIRQQKRKQIAARLRDGRSYVDIANELHVSSKLIASVAHDLENDIEP